MDSDWYEHLIGVRPDSAKWQLKWKDWLSCQKSSQNLILMISTAAWWPLQQHRQVHSINSRRIHKIIANGWVASSLNFNRTLSFYQILEILKTLQADKSLLSVCLNIRATGTRHEYKLNSKILWYSLILFLASYAWFVSVT